MSNDPTIEAVAAEREACAKLVDESANLMANQGEYKAAGALMATADVIRARGDEE